MKKPVKKDIVVALLVTTVLVTTLAATYVNYKQDKAVDSTKIPQKIELSKGFQKWITNLKNKDFIIEADEFLLVDENELFNTKNMQVYNFDNEEINQKVSLELLRLKDTKKVVYSENMQQYLDYRDEIRQGYEPNQTHYYGIRGQKLVDARLVECSRDLNCYFDRAFFVDNNIFVVSELSRNLDKRSPDIPPCEPSEECSYTFKLHVANLEKNSRAVYESRPFIAILDKIKPEL